MKFHVIMFNGPPGVGKDTLALYAQSLESRSRHVKYITNIKNAVACLFNYPIELMETHKDDGRHVKFGRTIRQNIIEVSQAIRQAYGQDIYGQMLADRLLTMPMQTPYAVVSDLGTHAELVPVVSALGASRVSVIRLHQAGRTFDGDCREYIKNEQTEAKCYDIENPHGDREYAKVLVRGLVSKVTGIKFDEHI